MRNCLKKRWFLPAVALAFLMPFSFPHAGADTRAQMAELTASLQKALQTYRRALLQRDVETMVSYYHAGLFSHMPKEQVIDRLHRDKDLGSAPRLTRMEYRSIAPLEAYDGGMFTILEQYREYRLPRPGDTTPQIDKMMIDLLKKRDGKGVQAEYELQKAFVLIRKTSRLLALYRPGHEWKFIGPREMEFLIHKGEFSEDLMARLQPLFPELSFKTATEQGQDGRQGKTKDSP